MFHKNSILEGSGAPVNVKGDEQPRKAGDYALVIPGCKAPVVHKGHVPFRMIFGVSWEFE